ncbi:MAG: hypothetical protein K0S32_1568 [Bacteroidetes bacterium]|jgi:hypothetical protein|nr:hypothetical protein [Bacteroidota bacterium]
MPSSIPYNHPSLVLGNIVDTRVLDFLRQIDSCQAKIDSMQDKLNSFMMMKRSMVMTMNELADMDLEDAVMELKQKQQSLDSAIKNAASDYMTSRIENETSIQKLRSGLSELEIQESLESPVDFGASVLMPLPLSAESLKMDSQYFSFGSNLQDDVMANMEKFIRSNTVDMGDKSEDITKAVSSQVSSQIQNHNIAGTLIIMASCTHATVKLFQPLIIDADKAVSVWNTLFTTNKINTQSLKSDGSPAEENSSANNNTVSLITGASYGSSFVGMVHILNSASNSKGNPDKLKSQLDEKLKIGGWLENSSGGFGIDESTMSEVKAFLSTQSVSSHVSMVTMGAVPSMNSNTLSLGVSKLAEADATLINAVNSEESPVSGTISSEADKAKNGARMLAVQNAKIQSIMKGLGKIDHQNNKVLDINSMMNAFENYLSSIKQNDSITGVPVNFYLKKLTKPEIEKLWLNKYYPNLSENKQSAQTGKQSTDNENT